MKNKIIVIAFALMLSLSACTSQSNDNTTETTKSTTEATEPTEMETQPQTESKTELITEAPTEILTEPPTEEITETETKNTQEQNVTEYVLNTSTMKIHSPTCKSVEKISPENLGHTQDLNWALSSGYETCKICKP